MQDPIEPEPEREKRYGWIEAGEKQVVVYDRERTTAWLQSDHTVELVP